MIKGLHAMFYCSKADELRAFFRDKLGFPATDVGRGWLICEVPEADLGCHPAEDDAERANGQRSISFYCDDIEATMTELKGRGVEFTGAPEDQGYGLVTFMKAPGGLQIQLYQPHYKK